MQSPSWPDLVLALSLFSGIDLHAKMHLQKPNFDDPLRGKGTLFERHVANTTESDQLDKERKSAVSPSRMVHRLCSTASIGIAKAD